MKTKLIVPMTYHGYYDLTFLNVVTTEAFRFLHTSDYNLLIFVWIFICCFYSYQLLNSTFLLWKIYWKFSIIASNRSLALIVTIWALNPLKGHCSGYLASVAIAFTLLPSNIGCISSFLKSLKFSSIFFKLFSLFCNCHHQQ